MLRELIMQQVGPLRHAPHHIFCQIKGSYCIFVDILALSYHIFWLIQTQLYLMIHFLKD